MKLNTKRITSLILVLLMTSSLLASCSGEGGEEDAVTEVDGIPVYDKYASREIDLGLTKDETILSITEVDGELQATIGVNEWPYVPDDDEAIPYRTEYRYYDMDYMEDTAKRKKTEPYHEVAIASGSTENIVVGGEPYEDSHTKGVQYHFYRNGVMQEEVLYPPFGIGNVPDPNAWAFPYSLPVHIMLYENVPFFSIHYSAPINHVVIRAETQYGEKLYVNDRFIDTGKWIPGYPNYIYCGLIGIEGIPYALLEIEEKGRLVPLTPETTELPMEGTEIEGCPTGGAFSDGRFGYFMSNSELWRTDGKDSQCIADLVPHGITLSSVVRSVCALPDGCLLVVADGKLIELFDAGESDNGGVNIYDIGILDYYGESEELNLAVSKYNNQADHVYFRVKEYKDKTSLNLALLSGENAMVITPNRFVLNNYVKQGFLASLEKLVPELFEENVLIENVVDAARVEGTSYYLPLNFELRVEAIADPGLLKNGKLF
ncbi:MAG: hypothetical protein IJB51_02665, partial [Clostridia bacterium]|nr:hypothetical protein [Clostridia bacterium]